MDEAALTRDGFLGGRITVMQPRDGYRSGTDAVLLAAAVPAQAGQQVLELGCGVGAAVLCLLERVEGLTAAGIEMQADLAALALQNAKLNGKVLEVVTGRIEAMPGGLKARVFDHVLANPPYFEANSLTRPASKSKDLAHVGLGDTVRDWVAAGGKRLVQGGSFSMIHTVAALPSLLGALSEGFGDLEIFPITSRSERPAERVIVRARKGRKGPVTLHSPLVMHAGRDHNADGGAYSKIAEAILRDGCALA